MTLNYGPSGSTARYEHLGKAAARLDDVLNFLPARLGVVVLCWVAGRRWRAAWSTWRQDGGRTASPNAGQTMACAAGALSVRLENDGHYVLSGGSRLPDASAIADGPTMDHARSLDGSRAGGSYPTYYRRLSACRLSAQTQ